MLEHFHKVKRLEHCIRKYTEENGIDECLSQLKVVGVKAKAMKSVLEGTDYAKLLKPKLAHAIEILKWGVFLENTDITKHAEFLSNIKKLQEALSKKWSKI